MDKLVYLLPAACILYILLLFMAYIKAERRKNLLEGEDFEEIGEMAREQGEDGLAPRIIRMERKRLGFRGKLHSMEKKDRAPLLIITIIYAVTAFWGLGDTDAPQTFCEFDEYASYADILLNEETRVSAVKYYSGLHHGNFFLQFSEDGEDWIDHPVIAQGHADLFKWHDAELLTYDRPVKYIRVISDTTLTMGEIAIYDLEGKLIDASKLTPLHNGKNLIDEQHTVPESRTYLNSSYFDEIYHARTAYENIEGIYPYEVSHPPLGKLIISIGIRLFGMTPFGWRFMGTLFGVLMVPLMYFFIKRMFGSTVIASCGSVIFAFDFMHFVQTRIATIDTYAVFFILLMYLFMFLYCTGDGEGKHSNKALFASGLFFGLGAASKWTVIYGGIGLALIWLLHWIFRFAGNRREEDAPPLGKELFENILLCILFFVIIPGTIYYLSYYPYGQARELGGIGMFFNKEYAKIVIDNQKFMFGYHKNIVAEHPYSSRWYQWVVNARPILYYLEAEDPVVKSSFGAFLNPVLCWGGFLAMPAMFYKAFWQKDGKALFILIGYFSQLAPWFAISRLTFEYHYFPCTVFLALALCHVLQTIREHYGPGWKGWVYSCAGLSVGLFAMFYPVLTGVYVPKTYNQNFLKWFYSWPF